MYAVDIERVSDGVIRRAQQTGKWDESELFYWVDGNMGCDCNRALEFARAGNEDLPDDPPCGESAYRVIKAILGDGREVKIDDA